MDIAERLNTVNLDPLTNLPVLNVEIEIFMLDQIVNQIGAGGCYTQIARYLTETRCFRCEDPRDRVFSVLSLVDWTRLGQSRLLPDCSMTSSRLGYQLIGRTVTLKVKFADFRQVTRRRSFAHLANSSWLLVAFRSRRTLR